VATATINRPSNRTEGCLVADPILIPDATTEPAAYVAALLRTLGDRDPLQVYEHTADQVRALCQDLDHGQWTTPMAEREWSALQVVGHLFDVDVVYGFRWRLALTEDTPTYPGYDEKAWSQLARPMPSQLLDALATIRLANAAYCAASTSATCADAASTANRAARTSNA
jgi:hypothetical protein